MSTRNTEERIDGTEAVDTKCKPYVGRIDNSFAVHELARWINCLKDDLAEAKNHRRDTLVRMLPYLARLPKWEIAYVIKTNLPYMNKLCKMEDEVDIFVGDTRQYMEKEYVKVEIGKYVRNFITCLHAHKR